MIEYRILEITLIGLTVINGVGILARYVFNHALGELFEIMVLASLAMYWLALGVAQRERAHLGVGIAVSRFPPTLQKAAVFLRFTVAALFLATVIYCGSMLSISQFRSGSVSGLLNMPLWTFCLFLPIGAFLMLVRATRQFLEELDIHSGSAS